MTRYALFLALCVALAGGIYAKGREDGKAALQARIDAAQDAAREAMRKAEAQRLAAQAEIDRLAQLLEDAANAEPVSVPDALPASRVRRIDQIQ